MAMEAVHAVLRARRPRSLYSHVFRVYLVQQHQPPPDGDLKTSLQMGLPVRWEDVDWVMDDEGVVLEDMRVEYEFF